MPSGCCDYIGFDFAAVRRNAFQGIGVLYGPHALSVWLYRWQGAGTVNLWFGKVY